MVSGFKKHIAECVGLWLAEGDSKSSREITFTNNCTELILHFHDLIKKIYGGKNAVRVYSYCPKPCNTQFFNNMIVKNYIDVRANKPYHIFRLADVKFVRFWRNLVFSYLNKSKYYPDILRGIFAGEGNIHLGNHHHRSLRISQVSHNKEFEKIFNKLNLIHSFSENNRMYNFTHKANWDIFAKYKIPDLHPDKRLIFWKAYLSYKENHYKAHYIRNNILQLLNTPKTKEWIASYFDRSPARIYDVLETFQEKGKLINYRVGSQNYWVRTDANITVISKVKERYLELLDKELTVQEIAKSLNVTWKSAFRRLTELRKLELVANRYGKWKKINTKQKVVIL